MEPWWNQKTARNPKRGISVDNSKQKAKQKAPSETTYIWLNASIYSKVYFMRVI